MSMSVGNVMSAYTYQNGSQLRPTLDKNSDGSWSKQEVSRYASDYKSATGTELDVDKIFDKYDSDGSGSLGVAEYESAIADDALGTKRLSELQSQQKPAVTTETKNDSNELGSWMDSLNSLQKNSLTRATFMAEQTSSLINSMMPANNSLSTLTYAIAQYDNAKIAASAGLSGSLSSLLDTSV